MRFIQLKALPILLIFGLFINTNGTALVKLFGLCQCEQFLYEEECKQLSTCQYENGKCSFIPCNTFSLIQCRGTERCAVLGDECVDFVSCSSHKVKTQQECEDLNSTCYFDSSSKTCQKVKYPDLGKCSQKTKLTCYRANEGLCVFVNGKCTEMTSCSDVKANDLQCPSSYPACIPNKTSNECMPNQQCKNNILGYCDFSKEKINADEYKLCQRNFLECTEFDPYSQTQETCAKQSRLYFHWDGNQCARCSELSSLVIAVSIMAILALNI